jgi:hypothetical protein
MLVQKMQALRFSETSVTTTTLHGIITQKTIIHIFIAVKTWNLKLYICI